MANISKITIESGTYDIKDEYARTVDAKVYDTLDDMLSDSNLENDNYAMTNGFYNLNDGGSAYYKIRTKELSDTPDNIHLFELDDNTLVAELININDEINLLQLGINTNNDASTLLQYAVDNYKKIIIPSGTYNVNNTITLPNNIEITGNGDDSVLLMANGGNDLVLFNINAKHNIKINNINLKNTSSENSNTYSEDRTICTITDSHDIIFNNFYMTNIYKNGIVVKSSYNLSFTNCKFKNTGYNMISLLTETENVLVSNCVFDTNTSAYTGGTYLIHMGSNDYSTPVNYYVKNITVENSKFLNNTYWEGIDCHGGENVKIINNYIYNCKLGIMIRHDARTPLIAPWKTHNIIIENNVIDGNGICTDGIMTGGSTDLFAENFDINNNVITGIKTGDSSVSVISFQYGSNFNINYNKITNFGYYGIRTFDSYYGNVKGNNISQPNGTVSYGFYSNYCWFIKYDDNVVDGSPNNSAGNRIIYGAGTPNNARGLVELNNNVFIVEDSACVNMRDNTRTAPTNNDAKRFGNKTTNYKGVDGIIKAYFTNAKMRSVAGTVSNLPVTATSGTRVLTYSGTTYPIRLLGVGEEITIAGAGSGGATLTTTVKGFPSLNSVELSDPIETSVSNATLSTLDSTMVLTS